jgi:hypothetical protein
VGRPSSAHSAQPGPRRFTGTENFGRTGTSWPALAAWPGSACHVARASNPGRIPVPPVAWALVILKDLLALDERWSICKLLIVNNSKIPVGLEWGAPKLRFSFFGTNAKPTSVAYVRLFRDLDRRARPPVMPRAAPSNRPLRAGLSPVSRGPVRARKMPRAAFEFSGVALRRSRLTIHASSLAARFGTMGTTGTKWDFLFWACLALFLQPLGRFRGRALNRRRENV